MCMQAIAHHQIYCPCCLQEELCRIEGQLPYRELKGEGSFGQQALEHWEGHQAREDSLILDIFGGQLQSMLQCPHCAHRSVSHTAVTHLTVPLPRSTPAQDSNLEVLNDQFPKDSKVSKLLLIFQEFLQYIHGSMKRVAHTHACCCDIGGMHLYLQG